MITIMFAQSSTCRLWNSRDEPGLPSVWRTVEIKQSFGCRLCRIVVLSKISSLVRGTSANVPSYLNFKGCEEEGLYRVPGSGREVKYWQRRFDTGKLGTMMSYGQGPLLIDVDRVRCRPL